MTALIRQIPLAIDIAAHQVLLIDLPEPDLCQASFLDERVLTPNTQGRWTPLDSLAVSERDDAGWIFHIGHCGSTLLSRLLDQIEGVLGLREPRSLRDLAEVAAGLKRPESIWNPQRLVPRATTIRRLLAQAAPPGQRAIVKATSHVSEIAPTLAAPDARMVMLYTGPQSYFETILAGENSRRALAGLSGPRLARLNARVGETPWRLWQMSEGERIALGWATEMTSLIAAADTFPQADVVWVDFDRLLDDPADGLTRVARHFGLSLTTDRAAEIVAGPTMCRYSKSTDHPYDPALRSQLHAQARDQHRDAIHQGLAWLAAAARAYAPIEEALRIAKGSRCSS